MGEYVCWSGSRRRSTLSHYHIFQFTAWKTKWKLDKQFNCNYAIKIETPRKGKTKGSENHCHLRINMWPCPVERLIKRVSGWLLQWPSSGKYSNTPWHFSALRWLRFWSRKMKVLNDEFPRRRLLWCEMWIVNTWTCAKCSNDSLSGQHLI